MLLIAMGISFIVGAIFGMGIVVVILDKDDDIN